MPSRAIKLGVHAFFFSVSESVFWTIFLIYLLDRGFSPSAALFLLSLPPAMEFILSPIWGKIGERRGRKLPLAIGSLAYSFLNIAVLGIDGFLQTAILLSSSYSFIAAWYPNFFAESTSLSERMSEDIGRMFLSESAGWMVGTLVASLGFFTGLGYTFNFCFASVSGLASLLSLVSYESGETPKEMVKLELREPLFFLSVLLMYSGGSMFYAAFVVRFYEVLGSQFLYSLALFLASVTTAITSPAFGNMAERVNPFRFFAYTAILRGLYFLVMSYATGKWMLFILFLVPTWNASMIPLVAVVSHIYKDKKAVGQGVLNSTLVLSEFFGKLLASGATSALNNNLRAVSAIGGAITLAGALLYTSYLCTKRGKLGTEISYDFSGVWMSTNKRFDDA